ncbi:MAG: hypothetical protein F6K04_01450 [Leptolyngbya sp. SIO4C5]|nr:hypothetical protein [Leptolyngbya sp. SIO4C5]
MNEIAELKHCGQDNPLQKLRGWNKRHWKTMNPDWKKVFEGYISCGFHPRECLTKSHRMITFLVERQTRLINRSGSDIGWTLEMKEVTVFQQSRSKKMTVTIRNRPLMKELYTPEEIEEINNLRNPNYE